jgi:hypothetical protein
LRRRWAIDRADLPAAKVVADHDLKVTVRPAIVQMAIGRVVKAKASVRSDHRLKNSLQ